MQKCKLWNSNLEGSAFGLGCMGMRFGPGPAGDKEENLSAVDKELTPDGLREIESAFPKITVQRSRLSDVSRKILHIKNV
jgi:hypothetical protein